MTEKYDGLFAFSIRIHGSRHVDLTKKLIFQGKRFGSVPLYGTCVDVSKRAIQVFAHRPMDDEACRLNAAGADQRDADTLSGGIDEQRAWRPLRTRVSSC